MIQDRLDKMRVDRGHGESAFWTPEGLVDAWRSLVDEIDRGYEKMTEEYFDDLATRGVLQELLDTFPEGETRDWIAAEVEDIDARYRRVTQEVSEPIFGDTDAPWWWRRVPGRLTGYLREDLPSD